MKNKLLKIALLVLVFTSCIVQSPKYTTIDKVMTLQLGMTKAQVEESLGLQPYDLKANTTGTNVFVYVYRITDRRTASFYTSEVNGTKSIGKYVQLFVTYSKDDKVINIETCSLCPDNLVTRKNLDLMQVFLFVTVVIPWLIIFVKG